ncbi:alpha/beta hydrolase family protein [Hymenobacter psychrophilus]|uniref:Predicted dienelactone hydrolase n=1 Tax=Hymenobacter psychrophilus TaxID=651662 RepID=A0A1H3IH88_9BACT|nr:hypothetical protein [Hymenobacter psychrophilus]SDY27012.1 Predicted dienelactone hydrolase [Hymenobacter psychrophilus]
MPYAAGYRALPVADPGLDLTFPLNVFYPTATPGQPTSVGLYQLVVAVAAPVAAGPWPVVLLSHGTGSSGLVHRNLALFLARQGYVVGMPEHPHNNRDDNAWANTRQNLVARPHHLQLALEVLLANAALAPALRSQAVALIGHSLGAYTSLALAGGQPWSRPVDSPDGVTHAIPVPAANAQVRALILLAPAVPWFAPAGALANVRLPILLVVSGQDEFLPPAHAEIIRRGVPDPDQLDFRLIENAGHYSFLSPFPPARVSPAFPPSQDPPGFDRVRFHEVLYEEVLAFLRRTVG